MAKDITHDLLLLGGVYDRLATHMDALDSRLQKLEAQLIPAADGPLRRTCCVDPPVASGDCDPIELAIADADYVLRWMQQAAHAGQIRVPDNIDQLASRARKLFSEPRPKPPMDGGRPPAGQRARIRSEQHEPTKMDM